MAKRSRRPTTPRPSAPVPAAAPATSDAADSTAPTTSTTSSSSTRTSSRTPRPRRAVQKQSVFDRYRALILGAFAVVGILIIGFLFLQSGGGSAYACESLLTPGPVETLTPQPAAATPTLSPSPSPGDTSSPAATGSPAAGETPGASGSPAAPGSPGASESPAATGSPAASASPTPPPSPTPEPTPRLGFTTAILGANHVPVGTTITYGFCAPTSGDHYNSPGRGPIRAAVYPPSSEQSPGGWVHNLEHGWVALAYRCPAGVIGGEGCPTEQEWATMQQIFDQAPVVNNCPKQMVVVRFDSMDTRFTYLAWGRALLTNEIDLDTGVTWAQQWTDAFAPENATC